jgi:hypothetical protein
MSLFAKKDITDEEYILKQSLIYLGMKRVRDDAISKITNDDGNKSALSDFVGRMQFLFVN